MLLSYNELVELVDRGVIDSPRELINGASIDVRLDGTLLIERFNGRVIDLARKEMSDMGEHKIDDLGYALRPGEFVLASTVETFNLPNDIACEFKLKSSAARVGLNNMLATWCDPTWHNSKLTLELHNCNRFHPILLRAGMKIGQMIFYRCSSRVPNQNSYRVNGRYNDTAIVTASKGVDLA